MRLIIHGGLLETDDPNEINAIKKSMTEIVQKGYEYLKIHSAVETVVYTITLLEDDPLYDAGTGSQLQQDGIIRMNAALSDGSKPEITAVINIESVRNPIKIAEKLIGYKDKALSANKAREFAMQHGFEEYSVEIPKTRKEFEEETKPGGKGTVGCVALDADGNIAAGTSTGGKGKQLAGRVADSGTIAGNYANKYCGISCTGTGEDIVNNALAAKIVVRVTDGFTIEEAFEKSFNELKEVDGDAGAIGLDKDGRFYQQNSKAKVCYATFDGEELELFSE
ncbi:isoaspartyl peptidase/L-asparaginase [Flavobacterium sp. J372]|uniref:isoaspartyl peptidase/L-asparaginase n=1 Tax=Flavobacterium sp. J372 TaxID=2898436 RepID=UPI002150AF04|nr:isoaspartyl peptidase/L-asparaginase [Flavobacterium sp. J372]MCR5862051.1 isoaspartyl peptidase/L-asparaginase [Flavobacterium sp. J372]